MGAHGAPMVRGSLPAKFVENHAARKHASWDATRGWLWMVELFHDGAPHAWGHPLGQLEHQPELEVAGPHSRRPP